MLSSSVSGTLQWRSSRNEWRSLGVHCLQISTGYVDDASTCSAGDPLDSNPDFAAYPTLLNSPISSAHYCKTTQPYCVSGVQAAWSAYR